MAIVQCILTIVLCCLACTTSYISSLSKADKSQVPQLNADPIFIEVSWAQHDYDLHTIPTLQVVV